jgi:transcriptional regulator with XRE-family HTH domain
MSNYKPKVDLKVNLQMVEFDIVQQENTGMGTIIGKRISSRLEKMEKTQSWLAEECNVSKNAVSKWIRSGHIARENAMQVSALLSIPLIDLLVSESPQQNVSKKLALIYADTDEIELLTGYREATPFGKETILLSIKNAPKERSGALRRAGDKSSDG